MITAHENQTQTQATSREQWADTQSISTTWQHWWEKHCCVNIINTSGYLHQGRQHTGFFLLYNPETTNPAKVTEMTSVVAWRWPEDHEGGLQSGTKRLRDHGSYSFSSSTEGAMAYECVELIKVHIWNGHFTADVNYTSRNRQRPVVGCLSGTYETLVQSPSPLLKI